MHVYAAAAGEAETGSAGRATRIGGAQYEEPEQLLDGQRIDVSGILSDRSPRRVVLVGWFQRAEYYRPHRARIRQWLAFNPLVVQDARPEVVVHVRRADYIRLGWALPFSYYQQSLELALPHGGEVWIATDDPHDPFFKRFAPWRPKFRSGSPVEQLAFLSKAARLVMSASTFSWWRSAPTHRLVRGPSALDRWRRI